MVAFIMTRRTLNLYRRIMGLHPLTSRTTPAPTTLTSSRTRPSSSSSTSKPKLTAKQPEVLEGSEEISVHERSSELSEPTDVEVTETNV